MVNETQLFYLVIMILLVLIVHFVLTHDGPAARRESASLTDAVEYWNSGIMECW